MPINRKTFFVPPYPNPTTAFDDLPQAVRDQWVGWAKANKVGYLDYQREIRSTQEAYEFVQTMALAQNGGVEQTVYPPEAAFAPAKPINIQLASATDADIISLPAAKPITRSTNILVWATATAAAPEDVNTKDNKFVGTFALPEGTLFNQFLADIGASYVAAFTSLAADVGKYLVLWCFTSENGQLAYLGGFAVKVKVVSCLGLQAYYPFSEVQGPYRSIARPLTLTSQGLVTRGAGPIDWSLAFSAQPADKVSIVEAPNLNIEPPGFSVSLWVNPSDNNVLRILLLLGTNNASGSSAWEVAMNDGDSTLTLWLDNGVTRDGYPWSTLGVPPTGVWTHLAATVDTNGGTVKTYANGALDTSAFLANPPTTLPGPFTIGNRPAADIGFNGSFAELSLWSRVLTATEIAALYNSGAGLRFPF